MAMITTHTTFTKSPKRHFTGREMDNSVVDTATTELALRGDLTSSHFITGKKVQSKRMRHRIDFVNQFIQRIISKNRHNRSENLFLHYFIFIGYMIHNCRFNTQCIAIIMAAENDFIMIDQT